jgi:hypothetical protein
LKAERCGASKRLRELGAKETPDFAVTVPSGG